MIYALLVVSGALAAVSAYLALVVSAPACAFVGCHWLTAHLPKWLRPKPWPIVPQMIALETIARHLTSLGWPAHCEQAVRDRALAEGMALGYVEFADVSRGAFSAADATRLVGLFEAERVAGQEHEAAAKQRALAAGQVVMEVSRPGVARRGWVF